MRLLEKQPEKRYQSGEELAVHLDELLAHAPANWDSPLDVPPVAGSNGATRADRGQLQHSVLELSKDEPGANASVPKPAPISIRSLERPGFLSIEAPAPVVAHGPPLALPLPDAIKAAAEKVGATARARRTLRPALVVTIGLSVVLVGVVAVAILGRTGRTQPENLLAKIQQQEQLPADARAAVSTQLAQPVREASVLPPAPKQQAVPSGPGAKRGMTTGANSAPPADDDDQPTWLKPVQTKVVTQRANAKFGVPTGAHIRARLVTNLDSRTVGAGPVEAKLMRPFVLEGRSVFPSGTVLIGNAATSGSRFTIRFVLLRLPDNREVTFEGLAYDVVERKPGLAATRATGAGRTVVNEQGQEATTLTGDGTVLLLDAPADLDVFVARAM